ncbi:MAG: hypothetical protein JW893_00425 [Candidatus Omnitrophica bacterium]|nr:hypothetical protein [Candidatus Omnitrophota bacterium]
MIVLTVSIIFSVGFGLIGLRIIQFRGSLDRDVCFHDPLTQFDPELGWAPIPSRHVKDAIGDITNNSLGFRSAELDPQRDQVVLMGDSVAWGYGVNDDQTISAYLDPILKPLGSQAVNLAVSGYGFDQHYLFLKRYIDRFDRLKTVILFVCVVNDFEDTQSNMRYGRSKPLFRFRDEGLQLTNYPVSKYSVRNLLSQSYLFRKRFDEDSNWDKFFSWIAGDVTMPREETAQVIKALLRRMDELIARKGAEFKIVLMTPKIIEVGLTEGYGFFQKLLEQEGYDYLDFPTALENQGLTVEGLYPDDDYLHLSPNGSRVVAEIVSRTYFAGEMAGQGAEK